MAQKIRREPMRKLKAMRVLKGYTLQTLAEKVGINYNTINQYELGIHAPRTDNLKLIAKALECDISEIM